MLRSSPLRLLSLAAVALLAYGCVVYTNDMFDGVSETGGDRSGGHPSAGEPSGGETGGGPETGGARETGGAPETGGVPDETGGAPDNTGGASDETGGTSAGAGVESGGTTGGATTVPTGGVPTAGGNGGRAGDGAVGGTAAGGVPTGGQETGGAPTGGQATGGTLPLGYTAIDMMDAANNRIELSDGTGYWYTYHDGGGTIEPDTQSSSSVKLNATEIPEAELRDADNLLGIHVVADDGFTDWGAGLGFALDSMNEYDVSRYDSLVFWARAGSTVTEFDMRVNIVTTAVAPSPDGTCTGSGTCGDAFAETISLTDAWEEYTVELTAPPLEQEGWGTEATFDPSTALEIKFQAAKGDAFDIWIDDVRFYKAP